MGDAIDGGPKGCPKIISVRRDNNVSGMMTRFKAYAGGVDGMIHAIRHFRRLTWEEMGLIQQVAWRAGFNMTLSKDSPNFHERCH